MSAKRHLHSEKKKNEEKQRNSRNYDLDFPNLSEHQLTEKLLMYR